MKKIFHKKKMQESKRGITVLIASLVASILLAIGLSIFSTTVKDLFFASTAKESEVAFYAADTAAECAQYWDIGFPGQVFPTSTDSTGGLPGQLKDCLGHDITDAGTSHWTSSDKATPPVVSTFWIHFTDPQKACGEVTVTKTPIGDGVNSKTTISSLGYDSDCGATSNRTVQRGIEFSY